ncbi:MAG: hypothetical protein QOF48_2259 [Verrucomicrobiota bacterium]|jgi:hypothetical protein
MEVSEEILFRSILLKRRYATRASGRQTVG